MLHHRAWRDIARKARSKRLNAMSNRPRSGSRASRGALLRCKPLGMTQHRLTGLWIISTSCWSLPASISSLKKRLRQKTRQSRSRRYPGNRYPAALTRTEGWQSCFRSLLAGHGPRSDFAERQRTNGVLYCRHETRALGNSRRLDPPRRLWRKSAGLFRSERGCAAFGNSRRNAW